MFCKLEVRSTSPPEKMSVLSCLNLGRTRLKRAPAGHSPTDRSEARCDSSENGLPGDNSPGDGPAELSPSSRLACLSRVLGRVELFGEFLWRTYVPSKDDNLLSPASGGYGGRESRVWARMGCFQPSLMFRAVSHISLPELGVLFSQYLSSPQTLRRPLRASPFTANLHPSIFMA